MVQIGSVLFRWWIQIAVSLDGLQFQYPNKVHHHENLWIPVIKSQTLPSQILEFKSICVNIKLARGFVSLGPAWAWTFGEFIIK